MPPLEHPGPVMAARFSPDGRRLLTVSLTPAAPHGGPDVPGAGGEVHIWTLATRTAVTLPFRGDWADDQVTPDLHLPPRQPT